MKRTKGKQKLIYKADKTYLPTALPAHYYGMPDNHVYVLYARTYDTPTGRSGIEFVIAVLEEFSYDYKEETLIAHHNSDNLTPFFNDIVDKYNQKMKIIKISRVTKTYLGAEAVLNKLVSQKLGKPKFIRTKPPINKKPDQA